MRLKDTIKKDDYNILVIDDEQGIIDSLVMFLSRYHVSGCTDPNKAIELVRNEHYDMIILDYLMMPIHGDKVVEEIRKFNKSIYILLLTGHQDLIPPLETIKRLDIQGYCEKTSRFDQILLWVESGIKSVAQMREIENINKQLDEAHMNLKEAYFGTMESLRLAVDAKDSYTKNHSDRVAYYSVLIGKQIGLSPEDLETLRQGALFHDIGKLGIPDAILQKPGKLSDEEYDDIKNHPSIGAKILGPAKIFEDLIPVVLHHHERYDGRGYPGGLKGEDIPLFARIACVADSFDAMTSDRAYRPRFTVVKAMEEMENCKGSQFDPYLVDAFMIAMRNNKEQIIKDIGLEY